MRIQTLATSEVDPRIGKNAVKTDLSVPNWKDPARPASPKSPSAPLPVNGILIRDYRLLIIDYLRSRQSTEFAPS